MKPFVEQTDRVASWKFVVIMVLFIMLWLPYNIIVIIAAFSGLNFIPHWLWSLSYWLCYLNSGRFLVRTVPYGPFDLVEINVEAL